MLVGNFWQNMQPINFITDYYGEEYGFYFAWLVHYTGWLLPPAVAGLVIFVIQTYSYINSEEASLYTAYDAFNNILNPLYSIFIVIWATLFVESWKRK
jgi:anoctamin-8